MKKCKLCGIIVCEHKKFKKISDFEAQKADNHIFMMMIGLLIMVGVVSFIVGTVY